MTNRSLPYLIVLILLQAFLPTPATADVVPEEAVAAYHQALVNGYTEAARALNSRN